MVEWKDVYSSSPSRISKLQLAAEQPSIGECWIPPKKDTPCTGAKQKPQQDGRRGEIVFRIKPPIPDRDAQRAQTEPVCTRTQEKGAVTPQETDPVLPVSAQEPPVEVWVGGGLLQSRGH